MFQGLGGSCRRTRIIHNRRSDTTPEQRPAPSVIHPPDKGPAPAPAAAVLPLTGRSDQRPQTGKAVSVHQPGTDQLLQGDFQFRAQQVCFMSQLVKKQCAMLTEGRVDLLCFRRQFADRRLFGQLAPEPDPVARQQHNGRTAQGGASALVVRGQASPHQFAAAAQLIEPGR
ncbi:hypothetical protein D3C87_1287660 [compost metagenome]